MYKKHYGKKSMNDHGSKPMNGRLVDLVTEASAQEV